MKRNKFRGSQDDEKFKADSLVHSESPLLASPLVQEHLTCLNNPDCLLDVNNTSSNCTLAQARPFASLTLGLTTHVHDSGSG